MELAVLLEGFLLRTLRAGSPQVMYGGGTYRYYRGWRGSQAWTYRLPGLAFSMLILSAIHDWYDVMVLSGCLEQNMVHPRTSSSLYNEDLKPVSPA